MSMLQPAEFRTLTVIDARGVHLKRNGRGISGDQISLASDVGCPKAMDHVYRSQYQVHALVHRHMNLVCSSNTQVRRRIWIAYFPPPLMPRNLDCEWPVPCDVLNFAPRR